MTNFNAKAEFCNSVRSGAITHLTLIERRLSTGHLLVGSDDRRGVPLEIIIFDEDGMILKSPLGLLFTVALEGTLQMEGKHFFFNEGDETLVYSVASPFDVKVDSAKRGAKNFFKGFPFKSSKHKPKPGEDD